MAAIPRSRPSRGSESPAARRFDSTAGATGFTREMSALWIGAGRERNRRPPPARRRTDAGPEPTVGRAGDAPAGPPIGKEQTGLAVVDEHHAPGDSRTALTASPFRPTTSRKPPGPTGPSAVGRVAPVRSRPDADRGAGPSRYARRVSYSFRFPNPIRRPGRTRTVATPAGGPDRAGWRSPRPGERRGESTRSQVRLRRPPDPGGPQRRSSG